jgi:hypothetical protein
MVDDVQQPARLSSLTPTNERKEKENAKIGGSKEEDATP